LRLAGLMGFCLVCTLCTKRSFRNDFQTFCINHATAGRAKTVLLLPHSFESEINTTDVVIRVRHSLLATILENLHLRFFSKIQITQHPIKEFLTEHRVLLVCCRIYTIALFYNFVNSTRFCVYTPKMIYLILPHDV